eukprot:1158084-Pelagomonas_calceolata.AAC.7
MGSTNKSGNVCPSRTASQSLRTSRARSTMPSNKICRRGIFSAFFRMHAFANFSNAWTQLWARHLGGAQGASTPWHDPHTHFTSSSSYTTYAAGLLLRELLRSAPEAFAAQAASEALPVAFGAKMDEDTDVAAVWKEVGV